MTDFKEIVPSVDVFATSLALQEEVVREKTVVVIDVLRASSTIVTALHNGVRAVIPVEDMEAASKIAQNLDASRYLLCGEKDGVKIQGYYLGNSPLEYEEKKVKGKIIIFNTTNGTKAIARSVGADRLIIGSFLNLKSVVESLKNDSNEILLVCAGWKNRFSLEDALCAGNIIYELTDGKLPDNASDGSVVAFSLYANYRNRLEEMICSSNHGARLKHLNGEEDLAYCSQVSILDVLPVYSQGMITNLK